MDEKKLRQSLFRAIKNGKPDKIIELIEKGIDIDSCNKNGETGLHYAVIHGQAQCLKVLVESNANMDRVDNSGRTALHIAVETGDAKSLSYLLDHGTDINGRMGRYFSQWTAMHMAAFLSSGLPLCSY